MRIISIDNQYLFELTLRHGDIYILGTEGDDGNAHRKAILGMEKQLYTMEPSLKNFTDLSKISAIKIDGIKKAFSDKKIPLGLMMKRIVDWTIIEYELGLHITSLQARTDLSAQDMSVVEQNLKKILQKVLVYINQLINFESTRPIEKIFLRHLIPNLDLHSFMVRIIDLNRVEHFIATENPNLFADIPDQAKNFLQLMNLSETIPDQPIVALRYHITPEGEHELKHCKQAARQFYNNLLREHASLFLNKRPYRDVLVCGEEEIILHHNQQHSQLLIKLYNDISAGKNLESHLLMLEQHRNQAATSTITMTDYDFSRARTALYIKKFLQLSEKSSSSAADFSKKTLDEIEYSMRCLEMLIVNKNSITILIEMCLMVRLCNSYFDALSSFSFGFTIDSYLVKSINRVVGRHTQLITVIESSLKFSASYSIYIHRAGHPTEIRNVPEFFNTRLQVQKFLIYTHALTSQATLVSSTERLFNIFKLCATATADATRLLVDEYPLTLPLQQSAIQCWTKAFHALENCARDLLQKTNAPLAEFEIYYFWVRAITEGYMCPQIIKDKNNGRILRERQQQVFNYLKGALLLLNKIDLSKLSRNAVILVKLYELDLRVFHCTLQDSINKKYPGPRDLHQLLQDYFHLTDTPNVNLRAPVKELIEHIEAAQFAGQDVVVLELLWRSIGQLLEFPMQRLINKMHSSAIDLSELPYTTAEKIAQLRLCRTPHLEEALSSTDLVIKFLAHCRLMLITRSPFAAIKLLYAQQELADNEVTWQEFRNCAHALGAIHIYQQVQHWMSLQVNPPKYTYRMISAAESDYFSAEDEPEEIQQPATPLQPIKYSLSFRLLGLPVGADPNLRLLVLAIRKNDDALFHKHLKASFQCLYRNATRAVPQPSDELVKLELNELTILSHLSPTPELIHALKQVLTQACALHSQLKENKQAQDAEYFWENLQSQLATWFENTNKGSTLSADHENSINRKDLHCLHSRM